MNTIRLKGVLRDIQDSHVINDIEFSKAHLIVSRDDGKEDVLNVRFKKYSNPYKEDQAITFSGNIRSYSSKLDSGKNKVELYVFTYFDQPDLDENDQEYVNYLELDGRICKLDQVRTTRGGKNNIHFIIANNLIVSDGAKKLNSYVPCIAWGEVANVISELHIDSQIRLIGQLHSREYKKKFPDGTFEFRVAHEVEVTSVEVL